MCELPIRLSVKGGEEAITNAITDLGKTTPDSLVKAFLVTNLVEQFDGGDEEGFTAKDVKLEDLACID